MIASLGKRLEQYTLKRPQEVLVVRAKIAGEEDEIIIFKGFSSSLMRSTAFDPDVPILPEDAKIIAIARLASPYSPENPQYIESNLTLEQMETYLKALGI
ncbi:MULTISPECIES: hypothetical protein [Spirulina sp. CCY15215]|uniref:DUF7734 family protein n=1 Tax=Spirulina sp. CCY15215 TaxID=2767591 RepID=UPI0019510A31|nr:hypothetical protein [Spirulina major]